MEERLDGLEEGNLLVNRVAARLRDIQEEEDCSVQMSESGHSLHLNGVSLIQRVVEDAWCVNDLPSCVLVVRVAYEQVLRRESIRLHIDICISDIVDEA